MGGSRLSRSDGSQLGGAVRGGADSSLGARVLTAVKNGVEKAKARFNASSPKARAGVCMACTLAVALSATVAYAASTSTKLEDHVVDTVSPSGTTINVFDYWITEQDAEDYGTSNPGSNGNTGINAGHQYVFSQGSGGNNTMRYLTANQWTGDGTPWGATLQGLVNSKLGTDGYPTLANTYGITSGESLAYLFDSSSQEGKEGHYGVTGLLQIKNGYYEYSSEDNYAEYDEETNSFNVYDAPAVKNTGSSTLYKPAKASQFLPFNSAESVFENDGNGNYTVTSDGTLSAKNITSTSSGINHYFGLSMSTRFVQPTGGLANDNQEMTFEFRGDDDTWVYIDDVLVGDLGGIHDASTVTINFKTGVVKINEGSRRGTVTTTLRALFEAAGASTADFTGDTFTDGSYHTLKFFYLERGNTDSNLKLKFNLVTVPTTDINKTDQNGEPVEGAEFTVYAGVNSSSEAEIGKGTTDASGNLILTLDSDGSVLNPDVLYDDFGYRYYKLVETSVPAGYRSTLGTTGLELVYTPAPEGSVVVGGVLSDANGTDADGYVWQTGAYAATKETLTATTAVYLRNADNTADTSNTVDLSKGMLFSVVMKKSGDSWVPVSGTPLQGYTVYDSDSTENVLAAAKADGHVFNLTASGQYQCEIDDLPGDTSKYYYMLDADEKDSAEYTVRVYYTDSTSLSGATNITRVYSDNFQRQFSARLHVSDTKNRLYVQKDDGAGNYISGAEFSLYKDSQVTVASDGTVTVNEGEQAFDTLTTADITIAAGAPNNMEGAGVFPDTSNGQKALVSGVYYLKETKAPEGYTINDTYVKVIVDSNGVHAYAGDEGDDDGVVTAVGPGKLLPSVNQFGSDGEINDTLTWVKMTKQTGTLSEDGTSIVWSEPESDAETLHLHFNEELSSMGFHYVQVDSNADATIWLESGWSRGYIQQDDAPSDRQDVPRTDLGTMGLNQLFGSSTRVIVTDKQKAGLEVTKAVEAEDGLTPDADAEFTFQFTNLPDGEYTARVFENANTASEKQVGSDFTVTKTSTHTITAGQTIRIYGLDEGDEYTVTEVTGSNPNGFSLTSRTKGGVAYEPTTEGAAISGTIVSGSTSATQAVPTANQLEFTNTYTVSDEKTVTSLQAKKEFSGRDWQDGDSFQIFLRTTEANTPMPEGAVTDSIRGTRSLYKDITSTTDDYTVNFGSITYNKPGTYTYTIGEVTPDEELSGVSYSEALYEVTVVVADNGDGTLADPVVTMRCTESDLGTTLDEPEEIDADESGNYTATFSNNYNETEATLSILAKKAYTDNSGANANAAGKFSFTLEALGALDSETFAFVIGQPSDADYFDNLASYYDTSKAVPMPAGTADSATTVTASTSADSAAVFPMITYKAGEDVDLKGDVASYSYVYKLTENSSSAGTTDGMSYDDTVYYITVSNFALGEGILSTAQYWKLDALTNKFVQVQASEVSFSNTYEVEPATVQLQGQKTLSGRTWATDETYNFTLAAANVATQSAIANGVIKQLDAEGNEVSEFALSASATGAAKGDAYTDEVQQFSFGEGALQFTKVGTYRFAISENVTSEMQQASATNGMTYDTHTCYVTVTVTDLDENGNHTGQLVAMAVYDNSTSTAAVSETSGRAVADARITDRAAFTNSYSASMAYSGINVTKTMYGENLANAMYQFKIENVDAGKGTVAVPSSSASFTNTSASEGTVAVMSGKLAYTFTQRSVGKTYVFKVSELSGSGKELVDGDGHSYDITSAETTTAPATYKGDAYVFVEVKAEDNAPGTLYAVTTVVKGAAAETVLDAVKAGSTPAAAAENISKDATTVTTIDSRENAVPTVDFANQYSASLEWKSALSISKSFTSTTSNKNIEKTFTYTVTPQDFTETTADQGGGEVKNTTTAAEAAAKLGIGESGKTDFSSTVTLNSADAASVNLLSELTDSKLSFTQADAGKTFSYKIVENAGSDKGVTYDSAVYIVDIAVYDENHDGHLWAMATLYKGTADTETKDFETVDNASVYYEGDDIVSTALSIPFSNTYAPSESTTTFNIQKTLTGRAWGDDETFSFSIAAANDGSDEANAASTAIEAGNIVLPEGNITVSKPSDGAATTGTGADMATVTSTSTGVITFKAAGAYKFAVTENAPAAASAGTTYDTHTSYVTVTVTEDAATGTLSIASDGVSYDNTASVTEADQATTNKLAFTNSYDAETELSKAVTLRIEKTLTGHALSANQFSFSLTPQDSDTVTAEEALAKLNLTDGATKGSITEHPAAEDGKTVGVTIPDSLKHVKFTLADAGKTYSYLLTEDVPDGATEVKDSNGNITGYTCNGYTYPNIAYVINITPADNGDGTMQLTTHTEIVLKSDTSTKVSGVTQPSDRTWKKGDSTITLEAQFSNSYAASGKMEGKLSGQKKVVDGSDEDITASFSDLSGFTFRIGGADDFTKSAITNGWVTLSHDSKVSLGTTGYLHVNTDAAGNFDFGTMTFTKPGKYIFHIRETVEQVGAGWTMSDEVKTVTVVVEDKDGNGTLTVGEPTIVSSLDAVGVTAHANLDFTNKYETTKSDPYEVEIAKEVAGANVTDDRSFSFTMVPSDDATKEAITNGSIKVQKDGAEEAFGDSQTVTSKANMTKGEKQTIKFDGLVFYKAGTYEFLVTENEGQDSQASNVPEGWTYDSHTYKVRLSVTDNNSQLVVAQVKEGEGLNDDNLRQTFTNSYGDSTTYGAEGALRVIKKLEGASYNAGEFEFAITASGSTDAEVDASWAKLKAANSSTDEGSGVTVDEASKSITFKNSQPDESTGSSTSKRLTGLEFEDVKDDYGQSDPTLSDVDKNYTYTVKETSGGGTGYTNDSTIYTVKIEVKKSGEGAQENLYTVTTVTKSSDSSYSQTYSTENGVNTAVVEFNNSYKAEGELASGEAGLSATKTLTGRDMAAGEFSFVVKASDGAKLSTGTNTAAANGAAAVINFSSIKFTNEDMTGEDGWGTYYKSEGGTVTVSLPMAATTAVGNTTVARHRVSAGNDTIAGVSVNATTDYWVFNLSVSEDASKLPDHVANVTGETSYEVALTVIDNGDGTLLAKITQGNQPVTLAFANTYTPSPVSFVPNVTKAIEGVASTNRGFTFTLTAAAGSDTAKALDAGDITASAMTKQTDGSYVETRTIEGTITSTSKKTVDFQGVTFKKVGTYQFTVNESYDVDDNTAKAGIQNAGWTMDTHTHTIEVNVVDDGGQLKVERTNNYDTNSTFTNSYGSEEKYSNVADFSITKSLAGHTLSDGQFSFTITAADAASAAKIGLSEGELSTTVTNNAEGTVANPIAGIAFNQDDNGKTFTYTISEVVPENYEAGTAVNGYTYDTAAHTLAISVVDDGDGTMTVTSVLDGKTIEAGEGENKPTVSIAFSNSYAAETSDSFEVSAVKRATGAAFADTATFTMSAADDTTKSAIDAGTVTGEGLAAGDYSMAAATSGTVANGGQQAVTFSSLYFSAEGTYTFKVTESQPNSVSAGWTYASNTYTVKIVVADQNGKLVATQTAEGVDAGEQSNVFTNSFSSGVSYSASTAIGLTKVLNGRDVVAGDFTWTLKARDESSANALGISASDGATVSAIAAEDGATTSYAFALGNATDGTPTTTDSGIKFTNANGNATYRYIIQETKGGSPEAAFDEDGNLISGGYTNDANVYNVTIGKFVDSASGLVTIVTTITDASGKTIDQSSITSTSDVPTTPDAVQAPFVNAYAAPSVTLGGEGGVKIEAAKVLENNDLVGDDFSFTVVNTKDADDETKVVATGTNSADGTISFTGITYTSEKLSADYGAGLCDRTISSTDGGAPGYVYSYSYQVSEDEPADGSGISRVTGAQSVTVTVTDKGDGSALEVAVTYPSGSENGLTFKNVYGQSAEAKIEVSGTKTLAYATESLSKYAKLKQANIAGEYEFTISGVDESGVAVGSNLLPAATTVTNDASGNVNFGEITYTMANVFGSDDSEEAATEKTQAVDENGQPLFDEEGNPVYEEEVSEASATRVKTFTYTVKESGKVGHVTNDVTAATGQTFTVTVIDNGDGTISVSKSTASKASDFAFTNTYDVEPVDSDPDFPITKTLNVSEGSIRSMQAGEFKFALYELNPEGGRYEEPVSTGTNDAEGKVTLPGVRFDHSVLGTHYYQLVELNEDLGGITYDETSYNITATVSDNGDGTLSVVWDMGDNVSGSAATFTNTYTAEPATFVPTATKKLDGRDLAEGEFGFELREGDEVLQTATNTAGGSVTFEAIEYTEVGEHDYTIAEVKGSAEGVTYDEEVYNVHVTVTDDGNGHLVATATYNGGSDLPVFTNSYTPEEPGGGDTPEDGGSDDGSNGGGSNGGSGRAPQTGDTTNVALMIGLGVGAAALVGIGITLRRRGR